MAALVNPSTGLIVDATGECYEGLVRVGFKPVEQKPEQQPAQVDEQPKQRRGRKPSTSAQ